MTRQVDATAVVTPAKFAHYVLRARDLKQSVAWYQALLGMKVQFQNEFLAFLTYDDEHHRLAIAQAPNQQEPIAGGAGLDHVAYTLESLGELLGQYARLKALDIMPVWTINHGLTTSMYYADPDGNRVEFQVENFATKAELNAYMVGADFAQNPIGVTYDADKLLQRYESGDPIEELVQFGAA